MKEHALTQEKRHTVIDEYHFLCHFHMFSLRITGGGVVGVRQRYSIHAVLKNNGAGDTKIVAQNTKTMKKNNIEDDRQMERTLVCSPHGSCKLPCLCWLKLEE